MKSFSLEEYLKNPSRRVVTKDGRNVRIICTDAKGSCPVVALVAYENFEVAFNVTKDGKIDGVLNLFFTPEKHEGWVNVFKGGVNSDYCVGDSRVFESKEDAENAGKKWSGYISVKIEWEE